MATARARRQPIAIAACRLFAGIALAQPRQVAITIDDLPRGGDGGPHALAAGRVMRGFAALR